MEYRKFEKLGIETSLLGFGCMRFPQTPDGKIDEAEAEKLLDEAMAKGITYYDTAYPYHGGASEPFVGKALKKYDRKSFYLATKLPMWLVEKKEDVSRIFHEQLERLDTDYVDFYLLHALDKERWEVVKKLDILSYLEQMRAEGKIRYIGFSFHDDYKTFEEILRCRDWDFCQIQYNYMDTKVQAGDRGYKLAEELGVPLVIMEPIKGGSLASLPDEVCSQFKEARPEDSISSWALRWVASHPRVNVVLSGMSNREQLEDNLKTFGKFEPLSEKEEACVKEVAAAIKAHTRNGCTGCRYCMPCPNGVDIPKSFRIWNTWSMYENPNAIRWEYNSLPEEARPDACIECGLCEEACPQHLPIREDLKRAAKELAEAVKA